MNQKNPNSLAKKTKRTTKKVQKTAQWSKEKIDKVRESSTGKKLKKVGKKIIQIGGSHLSTLRASITLSNEEAELMEKLKNDLNKKGLYPSKSEILRSGLWNLRKMSVKQLEDTVKDLLKVKQIRVL